MNKKLSNSYFINYIIKMPFITHLETCIDLRFKYTIDEWMRNRSTFAHYCDTVVGKITYTIHTKYWLSNIAQMGNVSIVFVLQSSSSLRLHVKLFYIMCMHIAHIRHFFFCNSCKNTNVSTTTLSMLLRQCFQRFWMNRMPLIWYIIYNI